MTSQEHCKTSIKGHRIYSKNIFSAQLNTLYIIASRWQRHLTFIFSFPVDDSLDLLGMTIDNQLNFDKHLTLICKKVNNQLNIMIIFRKLISTSTMLKLYKAFILPHFHYCCTVWHLCSTRNSDKLDSLNKRALRFVFNDKDSTKAGTTFLYNQRIHNMLTTIFKCLHNENFPKYLKDLLTLRPSVYSLRGTDILSLFTPVTILLMAFTLLDTLLRKHGTPYQTTLEQNLL
jgi:hypothetical protein